MRWLYNFKSKSKAKKLFFLHIPKAAGSSLNKMFGNNFGYGRTMVHIESDRHSKFQNIHTDELDFISGHILLSEAQKFLGIDDYVRVSLVRNPFEHILSHINWLRHVGNDPGSKFFLEHHEKIREFAIMLNGVDFSDLLKVEQLFSNLPPVGMQLLDNCQTKYLSGRHLTQKVTVADAATTIEGLGYFHHVGVVNRLNEFTNNVKTTMKWKTKPVVVKENSRPYFFDHRGNAGELKEILQPLIEADEVIFNFLNSEGRH